ncbi:MAG: FtsX-like permease family protein [Candidatus Firestonebacteria bacterium]
MRKFIIFITWLLVLNPIVVQAIDYKEVYDSIDSASLKNNILKLSSFKTRVTGYSGCDKAGDWIVDEFKKIGLKNIKTFEYDVVVPIDEGAKLKVIKTNKTYEMFSLWPNLIRTSTLPSDGITGKLVYVEDGEISKFNDKDIKDNIVLIDFNCRNNWLNAPLLGARAVVFIESETTTRREAESKYLGVPANIPRFWISKKDASELLEEKESEVHLTANMTWKKQKAKNIIGYIEGNNAELKKECLIINSYYDSMSVVPALSPGAESACGISALLELAKVYKKYQPGRTIAFLATSGHFTYLYGMRSFIKNDAQNEFKPFKNCFLISLDLSSQTDELGITVRGHYYGLSELYARRFKPFSKVIYESSEYVCKYLNLQGDKLIDLLADKKGRIWETYIPDKIALEHEPFTLSKRFGFSLVTLNDLRANIDSPLDNIDLVNISNLSSQVNFLSALFLNLSYKELPYSDIKMIEKDGLGDCYGQVVEFDPTVSFLPNKPVTNALVVFHRESLPLNIGGVRSDPVVQTDKDGYFRIFNVPQFIANILDSNYYFYTLKPFYINEKDGEITYSKDLGQNGELKFKTTSIWQAKEKLKTCVVLKSRSMTLFDIVDQRTYFQPATIQVFDARTDSVPVAFSYFGHIPVTWFPGSSYSVATVVVFGEENARFKFNFSSGLIGTKSILINADKKNPTGKGISLKKQPLFYHTPFYIASDMWILDDSRINTMKKFGIVNDRLNELHQLAKDSLEKSKKALNDKEYDKFLKYSREAWGYEARGYPDVQGTANDVIKGILFYLVLVIPFVFFLERLVFNFADIRKQVSAIFLIFIFVFLILHLVHPAFNISNSPYIIFLAFIIFMLGVIVIILIYRKFSVQMREVKSAITGLHLADISRVTTISTAVKLGISNIRKRPARAFLTSFTLILLTFAILSFTSVKSYLKFNKISLSHHATYEGILIRTTNWDAIEETLYEHLNNHFKGIVNVSPRSWLISDDPTKTKKYIKVVKDKLEFNASALLGLSSYDGEFIISKGGLKEGRWFKEGEVDSCIIPESIANALKISKEDIGRKEVTVWSKNLKIIGVLDDKKFLEIKDLDNEPFTPVNYLLSRGIQQQKEEAIGTEASLPVLHHILPDSVVVVPYSLAMSLGGNLRGVRIPFDKKPEIFADEIKQLMPRLALTIFVGYQGNSYLYSSMGRTLYSGLANIFIPVLIGALIVLNTMLGSVYERTKEIGTYSAVGLAPTHISALFLAESAVYATIGAITGYLLGQTASKLITQFQLLPGLILNYSSMSAVYTCGIVIITVIVSTMYPAIKAAQMAVPDVSRRWQFPKPQGNNLIFELPFTVNIRDVLPINGFLLNYFRAHTESTLGGFYTEKVTLSNISNEYGEGYREELTVWIVPFELGISQNVTIDTLPTEDNNIHSVKFNIERKSGEFSTWSRVNRGFLDGIRKQFLIWRTVSDKGKETYKKEGERELSNEGKS